MAEKCRVGDVIEIPLSSGLAYAQLSHIHPRYNALLRVLPGIYKSRPTNLGSITSAKEKFVALFPLQAAVNRDIFHVVASFPVPASATAFPVFRTGIEDPATKQVKIWWLWDGEKEWKIGDITAEQRKLPLRGIWNDTLLISRIESDWTPETDPS